jgi:hypothetical protein
LLQEGYNPLRTLKAAQEVRAQATTPVEAAETVIILIIRVHGSSDLPAAVLHAVVTTIMVATLEAIPQPIPVHAMIIPIPAPILRTSGGIQ